jgi:hypothetical protein
MPDNPPPPPPTDSGSVPNPPDNNPYGAPTIKVETWDIADPHPPNQNDFWAAKAAEDTFHSAYWAMRGWGMPRWLAWALGGAAGVAVGIIAYVIAAGFWALTHIVEPFAEFVIGTIGQARKEIDPKLPTLGADILGELTGADVNPGNFPTGKGFSDHLARVTALGSQLHDVLEKELAPNGTVTPDQGAQAARAFTGFNINFGIGTAFISILGELESLGFIDSFRELGEDVAKNLGLGRLHRLAMTPLMQTLITRPYQEHLHTKYRGTRLNEAILMRAYFRGAVTEDTLRTEMGMLGYSDDRINELITEARPLLAERQIIDHFFRFGDVTTSVGGQTTPDTKTLLTRRGFTEEDAQKLMDVSRPILEKNEIATLFVHGVLDHQTASAALAKVGYDPDTAELVLRAHSLHNQAARRLGLAELKRAFHNSVIDLLELKAHLSAQGYSDDDIQIITLDLLQPATGKVRQLSLAEIKAGFKAGVITEAQAAAHLKTLGYSDADIAVIVKTLTPPKAPATAGTPSTTPPGTPQAGG